MASAMRRAVERDTLGIGGVGGFVDTLGTTKRKRRGSLESSRDGHPGSPATRDAMKDEVEERLEEILFGSKSLNPVLPPVLSETDTDNEAEEEKVSLPLGTVDKRKGGIENGVAFRMM